MHEPQVHFFSRFLTPAAWLAATGGIAWRILSILVYHRPSQFVFSDMETYVRWAEDYCIGNPASAEHTMHPPGAAILFGTVQCLRGQIADVEMLLLALTLSVLPLVWWLATLVVSREAALLTLIFASVYPPFVDYGGFFLTEIPTIVGILLGACLFLVALKNVQSREAGDIEPKPVLLGGVSGIIFGAAAVVKTQALIPAVVYLLYGFWSSRQRTSGRLMSFFFVLGLALPLAFASARCTRLAKQPCLVANDAGQNILQGIYPGLHFVEYFPGGELAGAHYRFENPTGHWRNWQNTPKFDFAPWDNKRIFPVIREIIREHPFDVLGLCFLHVIDLLGGSPLWPTADQAITWYTRSGNIFFDILILLPILIGIAGFAGRDARPRGAAAWLLGGPVLGLMAVIFCTLGESRYRIPFDGFTIILASSVIVHIFSQRSTAE